MIFQIYVKVMAGDFPDVTICFSHEKTSIYR